MAEDSRGKGYRKNLFLLQATSTMMDILCTAYAPIIQVNCRAIFSDSLLAEFINFATFIVRLIFLNYELSMLSDNWSYSIRRVVLPPESPFCFEGWRKSILFLSLQVATCVVGIVTYLLMHDQIINSDKIPSSFHWIINKSAYLLIRESPLLYGAAARAIIYGSLFVFMIAAMLMQMLIEINRGMNHASLATQR
ncbi:hypothetical protein PMAYCL1PPCAC_17439, partial [Pristionchus mayeri]